MKTLLVIAALCVLSGCAHKVQTLPKDKVTTTVTQTTKVEKAVPVYRIVPSITTQTKTYTNDNVPAAPLHEATVQPLLQDAK